MSQCPSKQTRAVSKTFKALERQLSAMWLHLIGYNLVCCLRFQLNAAQLIGPGPVSD